MEKKTSSYYLQPQHVFLLFLEQRLFSPSHLRVRHSSGRDDKESRTKFPKVLSLHSAIQSIDYTSNEGLHNQHCVEVSNFFISNFSHEITFIIFIIFSSSSNILYHQVHHHKVFLLWTRNVQKLLTSKKQGLDT